MNKQDQDDNSTLIMCFCCLHLLNKNEVEMCTKCRLTIHASYNKLVTKCFLCNEPNVLALRGNEYSTACELCTSLIKDMEENPKNYLDDILCD